MSTSTLTIRKSGNASIVSLPKLLLEQIGVGIGDSFNDLPLLREADVAYALDFAPKQVQDEADVVVPSVAQALSDLAVR